MTVRQMIDALSEVKDKGIVVVDENSRTPDGFSVEVRNGMERLRIRRRGDGSRYVVRKRVIDGGIECSPLCGASGTFFSLDEAVLLAAKNVYDEVGWFNPDLAGRIVEVCERLSACKPYSFASFVWLVEKV